MMRALPSSRYTERLLTTCFSYINIAGWQMSSKSLYRWGLFMGWAKDVMLSQKAKYAMKALIALARADGKLLQSGDISVEHKIPKKFLDLIFFELRGHNMVHSTRGRQGGYA